MASSIGLYIPRFVCRKCQSPITIHEWRTGELCKQCRGVVKLSVAKIT
ncbi:MAG: hypothetical protein ACTSQI_12620 [Candidatus Helarchaeota archaeon]